MVPAYIGLGSNLDNPRAQIERGIEAIAVLPQSRLVRRSSLYASDPWGLTDQPGFVNAAVELHTDLSARELLDDLLRIERQAGRRRDGPRWGPRTLDMDILVYADKIIDQPGLQVPHPHLHERAFVLMPLAEIAPETNIPGRGSVAALLSVVDRSSCRLLESHTAAPQ